MEKRKVVSKKILEKQVVGKINSSVTRSPDLPLESRCFVNFCSMVFLVPHDYFCNSTSFGPKIIPKGLFKVPKKVKEFCSFGNFFKKPDFFRGSHELLRGLAV